MELAFSILLAAMNLMTAVNTSPNITPEFRQYAITTAQNAIAFAQAKIAESEASSTPVTTAPIITPIAVTPIPPVIAPATSFGSIVPAEKPFVPAPKLVVDKAEKVGLCAANASDNMPYFETNKAYPMYQLTVRYPQLYVPMTFSANVDGFFFDYSENTKVQTVSVVTSGGKVHDDPIHSSATFCAATNSPVTFTITANGETITTTAQ